MISVVLSVTLLGVAAAQEPAPVASSVANTECMWPLRGARDRPEDIAPDHYIKANPLEHLRGRRRDLTQKTRVAQNRPRPQAADVTCPVPWVMNAPTVGCLACGQKLEYAYTAMATTPWQVVAFENHTPEPVSLSVTGQEAADRLRYTHRLALKVELTKNKTLGPGRHRRFGGIHQWEGVQSGVLPFRRGDGARRELYAIDATPRAGAVPRV